jgi:hypothetical protein
LLIGRHKRVAGQGAFGAVASAIAVAIKERAPRIALLDQAARGGQFLGAQFFLGVGVDQRALPALGVGL